MKDLSAYLQRIGYDGPLSPSLDTLGRLQYRHMQSIPFENLSPFTGAEVHLDLPSLLDKLVRQKRGGYCYEQNLLFQHVLETLGFRITALAARVRMNIPDEVLTPRSHMLLLVQAEGRDFIVDTGFGSLTPTAPLQLVPDAVQETPHGRYRLRQDGGEFLLQGEAGGEWRALYRFDLSPHYLPDYEVANWYVSRHPSSHFLSELVMARPDQLGRHVLYGMQYSYYPLKGAPEKKTVASVQAFHELFERVFDISPFGLTGLSARLESLLKDRGHSVISG